MSKKQDLLVGTSEGISKTHDDIIKKCKETNKETDRILMVIEASRLEKILKSSWDYDEIISRMIKDKYRFLHVEYKNFLTKRLEILYFENDFYTVIINYDIYDGLKSIKVKSNNELCIEI